MKVLVYEHFAARGGLEPEVGVEGLCMLKCLARGFLQASELRVVAKPEVRNCLGLPTNVFVEAEPLEVVEEADAYLLIAPEDGGLHYKLASLFERSEAQNLGCSAKAILEASDKYLFYKKLRRNFHVPKTRLWKRGSWLGMDFPLVAKPRFGAGGQGLLLTSEVEAEVPRDGWVLQEFVEGEACSASLLVSRDAAFVLSVNRQLVLGFKYLGTELPLDFGERWIFSELATKFRGLFGWIGIDFVLRGDEVCPLELNPRPTTPIAAVERSMGIKAAKLLLENLRDELRAVPEPKRRVKLVKQRGFSRRAYISWGGWSIVLDEAAHP